MALKDNLKKNIHIEKDKLKQMSWKDKFWYIWEYYKFPIVGTVIGLTLVISIASAMYRNRFDTALSCVIINSKYDSEEGFNEDYFQRGFRDYLGLDENTFLTVDSSLSVSFDESSSQFDYAAMAKITALVAGKNLDVMFADPDSMEHYSGASAFYNLEEILPPDLYARIKADLYMMKDGSGQTLPYAVDLSHTAFLKQTGLSMEKPLLGILNNTENIDNSIALLRYIYEQ